MHIERVCHIVLQQSFMSLSRIMYAVKGSAEGQHIVMVTESDLHSDGTESLCQYECLLLCLQITTSSNSPRTSRVTARIVLCSTQEAL